MKIKNRLDTEEEEAFIFFGHGFYDSMKKFPIKIDENEDMQTKKSSRPNKYQTRNTFNNYIFNRVMFGAFPLKKKVKKHHTA